MRVAGDEQIHVAIAIVIAPCRAGAESTAAHSGLLCDILKFAVAQIVVEHVAVVASDKQVKLAIVIIVSHSNAHAPAKSCQTRFSGDVFEGAVWFLVVKSDHGVAALPQSFYG